jgi:hypothetical protein
MLSFGPGDDTLPRTGASWRPGPPLGLASRDRRAFELGDDVTGNCTVPFSVNAC